jgi:putative membrane protein
VGSTPPSAAKAAIRTVYYVMLITHIILAMAIAYLVPKTFLLALRGDFVRHRAWARWTFPIWYYVSVTGVLVYLFLYVWWPAGG